MYYLRSFQHAATAFAAAGSAPARVRHVRFFHELRQGAGIEVRSMHLSRALAPYSIGHHLVHGETGVLCASALDLVDGLSPAAADETTAGVIAPRSLAAGPHQVVDTAALLARGLAVTSHLGILNAADFDRSGALTMPAVHSRISDGASHLWGHIGIGPDDFYRNGMGRAQVEMKMTIGAVCRPGDAVRLVSWFGAPGNRTAELCHQLEDAVSGRTLACTSGTMLVLDMDTRRSRPMPPFLVEAIRRGYGDRDRQCGQQDRLPARASVGTPSRAASGNEPKTTQC